MHPKDTARINTRNIDTLIGICSGIAADGIVTDPEIEFLKTWIKDNQELTSIWPVSSISERLKSIIFEMEIDEIERSDLLALLLAISGTDFINTGSPSPDTPALPIDKDPEIIFQDKAFCFTGKFNFGTRKDCVNEVTKRGASFIDDITHKTDFLVIGSIINPSWAHSSFGRKIESAVIVRQRFNKLVIISEQQWLDAL